MKPLVYKKSRTHADAREPERHKMHIAKGDTVRVISGEHRGKEGKVLRVFPKEFRVEDAEHFPFLAAMLARDHAHRVALGDVHLVALGLAGVGAGAALLVDERLHVRSPRARATRSS